MNIESLGNITNKEKLVTEATRNALGAVAKSLETLNDLTYQNEVLEKAEDTIESNEYILHNSMRILR
jgi:hypothetical protein